MPVLHLPNGTRLHLGSPARLGDARFIVREIFEQQVYHHPGFQLRPADVILDVGGHIGVFAHWAAPQIPRGRIICVEPASAASRLEDSLAQNGILNVTLHRADDFTVRTQTHWLRHLLTGTSMLWATRIDCAPAVPTSTHHDTRPHPRLESPRLHTARPHLHPQFRQYLRSDLLDGWQMRSPHVARLPLAEKKRFRRGSVLDG